MINLLTLEPIEWLVLVWEFDNWLDVRNASDVLPDGCIYTFKWHNKVQPNHTKESFISACERYMAQQN